MKRPRGGSGATADPCFVGTPEIARVYNRPSYKWSIMDPDHATLQGTETSPANMRGVEPLRIGGYHRPVEPQLLPAGMLAPDRSILELR